MAEPILEAKGLKTYFYTEEGVLPGVDGLDFTLEQGKVLAIVGESGCGKASRRCRSCASFSRRPDASSPGKSFTTAKTC